MNSFLLDRIPTLSEESIDQATDLEILVLGDPRLRAVCDPVADPLSESFQPLKLSLHKALRAFRRSHSFGRSIAAPQLGIPLRFLAIHLGHGYFTMINPAIRWRSEETFTMWDDCLSLPDLLVKKRRACSISFSFTDDAGREHLWERCPQSVAELIQHEIDHLDGVLATDSPEGPLRDAMVFRQAFERDVPYFASLVDYCIQPI